MAIGEAALTDASLYKSLRKDADDQLLFPSFDPNVSIEIHTNVSNVNNFSTSEPEQTPCSSIDPVMKAYLNSTNDWRNYGQIKSLVHCTNSDLYST